MDARSAQALANERGLDLVKIAPQATPPVCKIMDYGKYKFEAAKREKENRKNQKVVMSFSAYCGCSAIGFRLSYLR